MVKLFYTKPALQDLKNINDYIAADSVKAAKRFISAIKEKLKILKQYPEIGKPIYPDKFNNLRQVLYKSYRIIYQLKDNKVVIITIHHQSRLPENIPSLISLD
jgi:addiction module RelE/StbE family toxin